MLIIKDKRLVEKIQGIYIILLWYSLLIFGTVKFDVFKVGWYLNNKVIINHLNKLSCRIKIILHS